MIRVSVSCNEIEFYLPELQRMAYTEYDEKLWERVKDANWRIWCTKDGKPKYLYSSKLKKFLHQIVIAHYFGEETLKQAYKSGMGNRSFKQ